MNPLVPVAVAGAALTAAALWPRDEKAPPSPAAPPNDTAPLKAGEKAVQVVPPAQPQPPPPPKPTVPKAAGVVATVVGGIKVASTVSNLVEQVSGKGAGDAAAINIGLAAGSLVKTATEKALAHVGVPPSVAKHTAITVGAAAIIGAPAVVIKGGAELLSAGVKAVAGQKVEKAVRGAVSQLDPTKPGSLANKAVQPVAKLVKGLGKLF